MDLATVVTFVYEAGNELVERCELVKQCHSEATRIAVRTVRVMGSLEDASREFSGDAGLNTSLIELQRVLQEARELVERCQRPRSVVAKARAIARANVNQQGLLDVEAQLLRITGDLHIPMQTDIRKAIRAIQQTLDRAGGGEHSEALQRVVREVIREEFDARIAPGRRSVRAIVEAQVGSSGAAGRHPAGEFDAAGQLMFRLGRVRFNRLEEGEDILGEGTFGVVYAGRYMGQEVAIKKARGVVGDPAVLREFRREAEIHFAMRHENIVRVLAFSEGSRERPPCLVMERMEESISSFLRAVRAPPPLRERLETIKDVCQGLVFLHQHRITHRDVKSQNILLDGGGTAKLSDFGLAVVGRTISSSIASSTSSTSATVDVDQKVGSEQYMAPEVHAGEMATAASDVFSLHVVMWEVLTHQKARFVIPIGLRLLSFSDAKLLVGSSVPTAYHDEAQALLNQCGRKEGKVRPGVEGVLEEVNSLLHKLTDTPSGAPPTDALLSPSAKNNRAPAASVPAPAPPPAKEEDDEDDDDPTDTPLSPSAKNRAPAASVLAPVPAPAAQEGDDEDDTDRNWRPRSFRKTDGRLLVYPKAPTTDTAAGATGKVASPKWSPVWDDDALTKEFNDLDKALVVSADHMEQLHLADAIAAAAAAAGGAADSTRWRDQPTAAASSASMPAVSSGADIDTDELVDETGVEATPVEERGEGGEEVGAKVAVSALVFAGPAGLFSVAAAAEAQARSPLLGSGGGILSVASTDGELATVNIVDVWNGRATDRYPIGCLSAILSPRTDEQVIALLSKRGMQVFSVTHRVRKRHEAMKASDVEMWKWLSDDVLAIVTKTAVLSWDVRGQGMPTVLCVRRRHGLSYGASRVCDFQPTADGRWGLLSEADKEKLCDGCKEDPNGARGVCACETSLMLDLHDLAGKGGPRCFRALGASLLDTPKRRGTGELFVDTSSRGGYAWDEPLLAAVVPDPETGLSVLQLLRLSGAQDGGDDCLCSAVLHGDVRQPAGARRLRKNLRELRLPAVPFRIMTWRPAAGVDLIAVVTLEGGMTVFTLDPEAAALRTVHHDSHAFPAGVVGVEEDCLHGDLVVLSAGVGEDLIWVVSRASSPSQWG